MKSKHLLIFLSLLVYFSGQLAAQNITVSGQIIDDDTEEPQPFANVVLKGTNYGTAADIDGFYHLVLPIKSLLGKDTIVITAIGYTPNKKPITTEDGQVINIRLKAADYGIEEIVILAGENPANIIVRNIIKNKEQNNIFGLHDFQAESYAKTELDIDNISEKFQKRKVMKPFEFVFENVDSVSDVKPFLPTYMTEEISDVYYSKETGKKKEIPRARKVSGIDNASVVDMIGNMHQDYNIYDNWIDILGRLFVSPFSNSGLNYYEYYIMDSTFIKDQWCYKLKFKPKRKQEPTFFGDFWVDMNSYAVVIVNMRMNPEVNINFVERVILYNESELSPSKRWLPVKEKVILDFISTEKAPGVIGRKTTTWRNYVIDDPKTAILYEENDPDRVDPAKLAMPDTFWHTARHDTLSKNEAAVYMMIDSIKNVPVYKTYVDVVRTIVTGFKEFGPIEIGPIFNLYSQNSVEGHRFKLGIGTTTKLSKRFKIFGYAAYGLKDRAIKYGGKFQYNIANKPFSYIGAAYKNDVELSTENSEEPSEDNLLAGLYRRPVPQKLLRVLEAKVFIQKGWYKGWTNRLTLLHRRLDPYFASYFLPNPNDQGRADSVITSSEIIFKTRYAFKEHVLKSTFGEQSIGSKYPILELQYTAGIKGAFGAQYGFHKLTLNVTHWFNVPPVGWIKYWFQTGKIFGTVPYFLLEIHDGNETYFYLRNAFNGMNRYEFVSDQWVQINIEHHWDGFFFNHIPLLRKLKWREVMGFKMIYGGLSAKNKAANRLNNYDRNYTDYRDNPIPGEGVFYGSFDPGIPYMEVSAGIENIFKFIRVDALWRLNYYNARYASKFTVRGTMVFSF